ncbi:MAG TPA: tRNA (guanine(10)-N(2))-dimethyltransferase [Candidatus Nitrosocosmicus sp.]
MIFLSNRDGGSLSSSYSNSNPSYDDWSFFSEHTTRFMVPSNTIKEKEPSKFPVFFNPAAKFNRDVSIQIYKTFIESKKNLENSFVDTMTGSGIRGLRVANEISSINKIIFNDINPFSIQIAKINSILNNVYSKCNFFNKETCNFLSAEFTYEKRATIIDIDPFGTPAPFLDCVLRSVENGGLISVTATDTAVLCGVYPKVCYRKYYGNSLRTKYSLEIGARLLLTLISFIASRMDLSVHPIFLHGYRNYIRVYCKIVKSNFLANKLQEKIGFVIHCFNCGNRYLINKVNQISANCDYCNNKVTMGGPIWISKIFDKDLISEITKSVNTTSNENDSLNYDHVKEFFKLSLTELDEYPYFYINDELGKILKKNVSSLDDISELLKKNGYLYSKTIFASNGFKTNASIKDLKYLLL